MKKAILILTLVLFFPVISNANLIGFNFNATITKLEAYSNIPGQPEPDENNYFGITMDSSIHGHVIYDEGITFYIDEWGWTGGQGIETLRVERDPNNGEILSVSGTNLGSYGMWDDSNPELPVADTYNRIYMGFPGVGASWGPEYLGEVPHTIDDLSALGGGVYIYLDYWRKDTAAWATYQIFGDIDEMTPIPEPSTMILLGAGLIGLAGWGRKKFKK